MRTQVLGLVSLHSSTILIYVRAPPRQGVCFWIFFTLLKREFGGGLVGWVGYQKLRSNHLSECLPIDLHKNTILGTSYLFHATLGS